MFKEAYELSRYNLPFAIVSIVETSGIVPRKSGRMLVDYKGDTFSTVGGGYAEREAVKNAIEAIKECKNRVCTFKLPNGEVKMLIDVINGGKKLYVIGYGHVGRAISDLLYSTGYDLHIFDINAVDCPYAAEVVVAPTWSEVLKDFEVDENSAVIITVHDKEEILSRVNLARAFYVGTLSSRAKGFSSNSTFFSPMGLDIGAESVEEIAISVSAEIIMREKNKSGRSISRDISRSIVVRGCGDLATAIIVKLHNAGYNVIGLDLEKPTQIRRNVSFAEAFYEKEMVVSGVKAKLIDKLEDRFELWKNGIVPVYVDPNLDSIDEIQPLVVIDAILAKKNLGLNRSLAPYVIGVGPGFTAGVDCNVVIETQRGHTLGLIIKEGSALENTGVPGLIMGYGKERVVRSDRDGIFRGVKTFGDIVKKGDIIAYVDDHPILATIDGVIRGMLHSGLQVTVGFKVADIDPRGKDVKYNEMSDKARAIAGGVLEAVDNFIYR